MTAHEEGFILRFWSAPPTPPQTHQKCARSKVLVDPQGETQTLPHFYQIWKCQHALHGKKIQTSSAQFIPLDVFSSESSWAPKTQPNNRWWGRLVAFLMLNSAFGVSSWRIRTYLCVFCKGIINQPHLTFWDTFNYVGQSRSVFFQATIYNSTKLNKQEHDR